MTAQVISLTDYKISKLKTGTIADLRKQKPPVAILRKEIDMFRKLLEDVKEGKVWLDQ
jgi:hypothetical protein